MTAIAHLSLVALDCPEPVALARFYSSITGWPVHEEPDPNDGLSEWVELVAPTGATLAFQRVDDFRPPVWPGQEHPQQLHLDFDVPDLDAGERAVLAVGATKAEFQPRPQSFRIYLDPVGHPFCLVVRPGLVLT